MPEWLQVLLLTLGAGLAIPFGGLLARIERLHPRWLETEFRHTVIAFGGGALLAAVALVLVPDGIDRVSIWPACIAFAVGGGVFLAIDVWLSRSGTSASQLAAMLTDFIPEAIALGATFASGASAGPLLALLIALQNLPEGFNAYRELAVQSSFSATRVLKWFALLSLLGPVAGLAGYFWLPASPVAVGSLMLFAAGGILYLVFQDIAPQAKLQRHWFPPLGAVAGFLLGMIGKMLLN